MASLNLGREKRALVYVAPICRVLSEPTPWQVGSPKGGYWEISWAGRAGCPWPPDSLLPQQGFCKAGKTSPVLQSHSSQAYVFFLFISSKDVYSISLCCLLPFFLQSSCHITLFPLVRENAEDTSFHFLLCSILLSCNFPYVTFILPYLIGFWKVWSSRGCSAYMARDPPVALGITIGSVLTLVVLSPDLWHHLGLMAYWKTGEKPTEKRVV